MNIKIISDSESFKLLVNDWTDLFSLSENTVFQSFEFNYYSWKNELSRDLSNRLCLVLLKKDQSDIIEMRFFEKLSFNEIGEILGITGNNAKIRLYRAVDQLKKIFKANP